MNRTTAVASLSCLLLAASACIDAPTQAIGSVDAPALTAAHASVAVINDPVAARLGKRIFEDTDLSLNKNQSCASCHDADWGFTAPDEAINAGGAVMEGSVPGRFGNRRPPTAAYATLSPVFHFDPAEGLFFGGNFHNGRATGELLGNPAADQALAPFVNPAEQALPDIACVVYRVSRAEYRTLYNRVFGNAIFKVPFGANADQLCGQEGTTLALSAADRQVVETAYDNIALAIAAFENSEVFNQFTSKFDYYRAGRARLTDLELQGLELFESDLALCSACHPSEGSGALFTDFSFDNIGTPANPDNPALLSTGFRDKGLGETLQNHGYPASVFEHEFGKHKVPTLRNVDKRPFPGAPKSFMHNGAFKSLQEVVHFYNTRDVLPECASPSDPGRGITCWPEPEIRANVNVDELGNLGLTAREEAAIVAFLRTLTDGYRN